MDRRFVLGLATGALLGGVAGRSWPDAPVANDATTPSLSTSAKSRPRMAPRRVAPAAVLDETQPPSDARELAVRAVADLTGDGVIRCAVPSDLPEGPVIGVGRAWVADGTLFAAVEEQEGGARLWRAGELPSAAPLGVVRWWGAFPGETGRCEVLPPERVPVSGRVVDAVGGVIPFAEVGNLVDGAWLADEAGSFTVECWLGARCPISARRNAREGWGPFLTVVADRPTDGVDVVMMSAVEPHGLRSYVEERVAEDVRLADSPDPLRLALDDPSLPVEARALIEDWLAEQADYRTTFTTLLADLRSTR